ncbi:NlpC/P60 family protein [Nocardia lijiangensis]|uniref:NlpC/P60 family protein n=1 Tax=Nocardia lijiangensis TaxID=299618 RepID=UPI00082DBF20|nr:NlpC/P60 family protein [Nocardia lijiangensis]
MTRKPLRRMLVGFVVATFATLLLAGPAWSDTGSFSGLSSGSGTGSASGSGLLPVSSPRGLAALAIAMTQTGKPYEWGGTGPNSWDCSGLVQWAFRQVGVNMPRTTWQQAKAGVPVAPGAMAPGDVVVLNSDGSHVGIYAGFGQIFNAYGRGVPVGLASLKKFTIYAVRRF